MTCYCGNPNCNITFDSAQLIVDDPYDVPRFTPEQVAAQERWFEEQVGSGRLVPNADGTSGSIYDADGNRVGGWFQTRIADAPWPPAMDFVPIEPRRIVPRAMTDVQRRGGRGTP